MVQQNEAKYINEWLQINYPDRLQWKRVRLGPLPDVVMARMFMVAQHWADAIVYDGTYVVIVEAKLRNVSAGIGQLLIYKDLLQQTPAFSDFQGKPVKLILLSPVDDKVVKLMCERNGIEYSMYLPEWIKPVLGYT